MSVIGTAGHVDHGKSALVKALTGIDPDRLQEEKDRGMTIDLGFAWLRLPGGREASIVDVPGHESFIKNMLAGVGGIDLALLVVAADDGVMPQTREHLAILDLLDVGRGLIAITKKDMVDEEWLALVIADVEQTVRHTFLAGAPILAVSSISGEGLPDLLVAIDRLLGELPAKRDVGRPRLPVDRVFTMPGFGTVVTGTLVDGRLAVGQEVELVPGGLRARIRGLQAHRRKLEIVGPGTRVAINLANVPAQGLERGVTVTTPGWLEATGAADVKLSLNAAAADSLAHGAGVMVHLLASQVSGRLRLLDRDELRPGEAGWAQIRFAQPLATARGDRFIIRNAAGTIGGGQVVDAHPMRHRRFHGETLGRLEAGEQDARSMLLQVLEKQEPCNLHEMLKSMSLSAEELRAVASEMIADGAIVSLGSEDLDDRSLLLSSVGWARTVARTEEALKAYHRQYPLRAGMPKEELKSRLRFGSRATAEVLQRMLRDGQLVEGRLIEDGTLLRLAEHEVKPTGQQLAAADALVSALEENPYSPPADLQADPELVGWLVDRKRVVRIGDGILVSTTARDCMLSWVVDYIKANGRVSHVELREKFGNSRRIAFAVLEHLDQERITRRVGNDRVLR